MKKLTSILSLVLALVMVVQPVCAIDATIGLARSVHSPELVEELSKPVHASNYDVFILLKQVTEKEKKAFALSSERLANGRTWYQAVQNFVNMSKNSSISESKEKISLIREHYYAYYGGILSEIIQEYNILEKQCLSERDILTFYNLSVDQINAMKFDSRIEMISLYDPVDDSIRYIDDSDQVVRSDDVRNIGYTGDGITIGVVDAGRNIWGQPGVNQSIEGQYVSHILYVGEPTYEQNSEHAARVVGILRHVAPEANILLARGYSALQIQSAVSTLINTYGVDIISMSIGVPRTESNSTREAMISFLNSVVCDANATICCATGNDPPRAYTSEGDPYYDYTVETLAMGANVIGVGAVNSGAATSPGNSVFYPITDPNWIRYRYEDNEGYVNKPDIVAPGAWVGVYGLSDKTGTSFSTPLVAGSIALLMEESSYLIGRQSMVKALLAAGARYKGDASNYETTNNMCFSDYEGSGVLNTYASYSVRVGGRYTMQTVMQAAQGQSFMQNINVTSADAVIRVALSWLEKTNMSNFILKVYKGDTLIASHDIYGENLRVVEFSPVNYGYGTYTIKVEYDELNNSSDTFSLAWY